MTVLNTADAVMLGAAPAGAVYLGADLVWPSVPAGPTYTDIVLGDSPSGFWRLEDPAGSTSAAAEVGSALTVTGGVTFGQSGPIVGDADTSPLFNGTSGLLNGGGQTVSSDQSFTHEALFRTAGTSTNLYMLGEGNTSQNNTLVGLSLQAGKVQGIIRNNANTATTLLSPTAVYADNVWHHAVLTADGTTARLYVNGSEVANAPVPGGTVTATTLTIGAVRRVAAGLFFPGWVSVPATYPSALSAGRVLAHYQAGSA